MTDKGYGDYCESLDRHAEALDRNSQMQFLLWQERQAGQTATKSRLGSKAINGSYQLTDILWNQILPKNAYRQEVELWWWSSDATDALVLSEIDTTDVVTIVQALQNEAALSGSPRQYPTLPAFLLGASGTQASYGAQPTGPITIRSTDALYAATFNASRAAGNPIIGANGVISWIETVFVESSTIPRPQEDARPKPGQLLKPTQEVARVVGDVRKEVQRLDLD